MGGACAKAGHVAQPSAPGSDLEAGAAALQQVRGELQAPLLERDAPQKERDALKKEREVKQEDEIHQLKVEFNGVQAPVRQQPPPAESRQPAAVQDAEQPGSAPEASARRFARCYAMSLTGGGKRRTRPRSRGTLLQDVGEGGVGEGFAPVSLEALLGGAAAAANPRRQVPGAPPPLEAGGDVRHWWCGWEEEGGLGRQGLQECYTAQFGEHAPQFRPMLREMRRMKRDEEEESRSRDSAAASATQEEVTERFNMPTRGGPLDEEESAPAAGNLQEQADGVMQLEGAETADVTVVARARPFLEGEEGRERGLEVLGRMVRVGGGGLGPGRIFSFNAVVGEEEDTGMVFEQTGALAAKEVARGVSAVIFAFGQTGSGKTYTMMGGVDEDGVRRDGVAAMTFEALSEALQERTAKEAGEDNGGLVEYSMECSMLQVYLGSVYDLLASDPSALLRIRTQHTAQSLQQKGGATCELCPKETALPCRDAAEFAQVLERGLRARTVRANGINRSSSRSHCLVTLAVRRTVRIREGGGGGGRDHLARLVLVDLAGNERQSTREGQAEEEVLRAEGVDVNRSLTALSSVLRMRSRQSRGNSAQGSFREASLTRLLQEPLMSAKIFFVPCVSPLQSAEQASSLTLGYATLVKRIRTDAEQSAVLLERGLDRFPIEFLPHSTLVSGGKITRSSEGGTVYLHELRAVVVKIFVSHRWLKPSAKPSEAHPDADGNPKQKLLCSAVQRMVSSGWIRSDSALHIVDWVDYSCVNQDSHNPAEQLNGTMGRIIGTCDLTLTPVCDPEWEKWAQVGGGEPVKDALEDYKAEPFLEYLGRGWCRLEMFFTANMPWARLFGGSLADVMRVDGERRRPHIIYGTREDCLSLDPLILRKLHDAEFAKFHPGEGFVFKQSDSAVIGSYVQELFRINANLRVGTLKSKPEQWSQDQVQGWLRIVPLRDESSREETCRKLVGIDGPALIEALKNDDDYNDSLGIGSEMRRVLLNHLEEHFRINFNLRASALNEDQEEDEASNEGLQEREQKIKARMREIEASKDKMERERSDQLERRRQQREAKKKERDDNDAALSANDEEIRRLAKAEEELAERAADATREGGKEEIERQLQEKHEEFEGLLARQKELEMRQKQFDEEMRRLEEEEEQENARVEGELLRMEGELQEAGRRLNKMYEQMAMETALKYEKWKQVKKQHEAEQAAKKKLEKEEKELARAKHERMAKEWELNRKKAWRAKQETARLEAEAHKKEEKEKRERMVEARKQREKEISEVMREREKRDEQKRKAAQMKK